MMMGYFGAGPWMWLGPISMLLFWGLVIVGVVLALRTMWSHQNSGGAGSGSAAVDILDQRYARGEITREEYQRMREDLGRGK